MLQAAKSGATLDLGSVNEEDETWVNGKDVGASSFANRTQHQIRTGLLKAGVNVIATNIFCSWRNCGIRGVAENRAIRFADGTSVPLSNPWKYEEVSDTLIAPQLPWGPTHGVTLDYNGMISPIGAYGFRGAVWYQGESDIYFARNYKATLLGMMADWRRQFENVLLNAGNATRVRYAWGESPVCSVYDDSGLPAGPFEVAVR